MMARTLNELFMKSVHEHSDKTAVIEDTGYSRCSLTYKDLWKASQIVSKTLVDICDRVVPRSQFIAVCLDQSLIFPAVILGIMDQGYGFAYIDPVWSVEKQNDYLEKLGAPYLFYSDHYQGSSLKDDQYCINLGDNCIYILRCQPSKNVRECSHQMAYAVLTSGSTGEPKIVKVPQDSIVPNVIDIVRFCKITSSDVIFLSSPSTFDPSVVDIFTALTCGASILITSKSVKASPGTLLQVLFPSDGSQSTTVLQMTPSVFFRWSKRDLREVVLSAKTSLKVLILGGEPFPSQSKLMQCRGDGNQTLIFNIYGITEVSSWASIHQVLLPPQSDSDEPVQLGQPLSDTHLEVRDHATGAVIETGCGEMFIGSSSRICEVDRENCSDYKLPVYRPTGDIVQVYPGRKICYIGRKDNVRKRWGHRISLEKVEHIAMSHSSIKIACCVWDEIKHKLLLIVEPREALPMEELKRHLLLSVGSESALVPDRILQVEDIPLTIHGKVNRHSLAEKYLQINLDHLSSPTVSEIFCNLWREVLGLQDMETPEASFLDFGGTSILAVTFMSELEQRHVQVPDDFVNLLLSGEKFQVIFDRLCQFHQNHSASDSKQLLPNTNKLDIRTHKLNEIVKSEQETCEERVPLEENGIILFSVRGRSIGESALLELSSVHSMIMELSWKVNVEKCIDASPLCMVYRSGKIGIVIGSHSGKFVFLDGCTGIAQWSLSLPDRVESSAHPSSCGHYLFIGCYDGVLYCVSSLTGEVQWTFQTKGMIKCSPVLCNNGKSVIFGSYDTYVYCVLSKTGKLQWSSCFFNDDFKKGSWLASPLVVKDVAILCSLACKVAAVHTDDGTMIWSVAFQSPIFSTPCTFTVLSENYVVIAEVEGNIHCLKVNSGKQLWSWKVAGHIFAPVSLVPSHSPNNEQFQVLVGCYDNHVHSLLVSSERVELNWRSNLSAAVSSAPFPFLIRTADGTEHWCATVINSAGCVFVLNLQDGIIYTKYDANAEVFSSPVVYKDKVFFGCRDDNVYCLQLGLVKNNKFPDVI